MKKIRSIDLSIFLVYIFQAFFYLLFINKTISKVNYSYLIFILISIFLGISIIILFSYLFNLNNKNIFQNLNNKFLVFIFLLVPLLFAMFSLTNITSYINYVYLNDLDKLYISLSFIIIIFYFIKNDTLSFFRCSTLIFYFYVLLEIITFILLLFYLKPSNLLPMTFDLEISLNNSYMFIIFMISPILLLLFLSKNLLKDNKKIGKKIFITYLIISFILFIKSLLTISILGYSQLNIYNYPDIILYKNINLFGFLERVEWLLAFNSIINFFFLISLSLFYIKEGLNYIYPLKKDMSYLYPLIICLITFLGSYFLNINYLYVVYGLVLFIVLHLTFVLFSLLK